MQNKNIQDKQIKTKIKKMFKKILEQSVYYVIPIILLQIGGMVAFAQFDSLGFQEKKLLKLEEEKNQIEKEICQETVKTANKKMAMYYDGDLELTQEDLDRIEPKTKLDCEAGF